jgi:cell division septation protein DedD
MESLANRPRALTSRFQRAYRVEMGGRSVLISLGLAILTGLVIFYMGVLTGKGSRIAETPQLEPSAELSADQPKGGDRNLAFSESLLQDKPVVEDLWQTHQQAARETQDLLARAQRELTVEEVPAPALAKPAASPPAQSAPPVQPRAETPAAARPSPATAPAVGRQEPAAQTAARDEGIYTVQVFSSKSRDSAVSLVNKLKGLGFAAYLNQFQDSGRHTWYRVRVGKTNRAEAERLKSSLQERASLKSPQVLPL